MSVTIKSEHELEKMREAGRILGIVHDEMAKIIRPALAQWISIVKEKK